jgi:hypothetical protein
MSNALTVDPAPGRPLLLLGAFDVGNVGYAAEEFLISGTACSYTADGELGTDGRWSVTPSGTADYTTRAVALTPADRARFNGTVLVEWLNVSGGIDAPAVWMMAHREIVRAGYAYVAVSAQQVGVQGGGENLLGIDMSLKSQDPDRYGPLCHPGDAFSYDIFSQVGSLIRGAGSQRVLPGLDARNVVAVGESQSAMFLTSYINAVDPLARVFDGFLVHSRFASAAPLDGSSIFDEGASAVPEAVAFRSDLRVPLVTIITETDLFGGVRYGYYFARQPDNESLRVWEIPGAAHADNYTILVAPIDSGCAPLDDIVAAYAPTNMLMGQQLGHYINFAPQHHYVVQAAIAALNAWVRTGVPAPSAPCIEVSETDQPRPSLDANGIAQEGVRTPWVDVPTARTSGDGALEGDNIMSAIFGSGEPFDTATLRRLYPGGQPEYLDKFAAALDTAIGSGYILAADRAEILELAAATYPN